jgi:2-polyprenyl-3-methyl-5-hydroxy-6-metoxy-1,4-benzoquinol methylase
VGSFATDYLPQVSDVHEKLKAGARVADVACGVGWAAVSIARGYPATTVDGTTGRTGDRWLAPTPWTRAWPTGSRSTRATRPTRRSGQHDLAVIVDALHDMSRPVDVPASVRRLLAPCGTLIVADERVADAFHAPAGDTERLFYGYSVLIACRRGWSRKPSVETGTVMRRSTLSAMPRQRVLGGVGPAHRGRLPALLRLDP